MVVLVLGVSFSIFLQIHGDDVLKSPHFTISLVHHCLEVEVCFGNVGQILFFLLHGDCHSDQFFLHFLFFLLNRLDLHLVQLSRLCDFGFRVAEFLVFLDEPRIAILHISELAV